MAAHPAIRDDREPVSFSHPPKIHLKCYCHISLAVFQVDVLREVSPPKLCVHLFYPNRVTCPSHRSLLEYFSILTIPGDLYVIFQLDSLVHPSQFEILSRAHCPYTSKLGSSFKLTDHVSHPRKTNDKLSVLCLDHFGKLM